MADTALFTHKINTVSLPSRHHHKDWNMDKIALGLDVSKLTIDVCFYELGDFMKVENNQSGIEKLIECIKHYQQKGKEVYACCEYTGNYYLQVAYAFYHAGIKISVVNPLAIKLYAEYRLRRTKTDKQDAKLIADYCQRESPPLWQPLSVSRNTLKCLNRRVEQLTVLLNMETNRRKVADWTTQSSLDRVISLLQSEIEQCRKEMQSLIEQDQELNRQHELLQTIDGVGQITATWLLSVLVDIDKFPSSRKLISYLGLSPMVKDSGTSVKMTKVSKMGDKFVRKALYIPARVVCLRSKFWRPWFDEKIKQGKHPKQIYILMMCKIIKYAYAVLKSGQPFDRERHRKAA